MKSTPPYCVVYPMTPLPKGSKVRYRHAPRVGGHTYRAIPAPPTTKKYY